MTFSQSISYRLCILIIALLLMPLFMLMAAVTILVLFWIALFSSDEQIIWQYGEFSKQLKRGMGL